MSQVDWSSNVPFADSSLDCVILLFALSALQPATMTHVVDNVKKYLKPGGVLAVSELTWSTDRRPEELQAHWEREYPEVGTASSKIAILERLGFSPIWYFPLPEHCWLDNFYRPLQQRFSDFLNRHEASEAARLLVAAE